MIATAAGIGLGVVALAMLLAAWRIVRGPSAADRVLALDTLYVDVVAAVVLLGIARGTPLLFEAALVVALLGFASTVALARYVARGDVME
jgi:multicomponent K+:H+ antiporter subunit F